MDFKNFSLIKRNKKLFIERYKDEKAEPLFLCQKKEGFFKRIAKKREQLFFKIDDNCRCKYNKKVILLLLPILTVVILTGGVCMSFDKLSINESTQKSTVFEDADKYDKDVLLYVNRPNIKKKKDFKSNITEYNKVSCNDIIVSDLKKLILSAQKEGLNINVVSGYISDEFRNEEYNRILNDMLAKGYTNILSEAEAKKNTFKYYEMETGLSIKFSNSDDFINTNEYKWLIKNSVDFGFVLRAPKGKEVKTNIDFDPTLFRYVGISNAKKMRMLSMCLEEYRNYMRLS